MTSIREVAKLANVSPATVSRVMNGTARVDEEKRERVLKVIKDTGFVPNEVARSLFRKSAKTIGLVIPSIENPFFTHMARAIEKEADANGYRVILYNTDSNFEKEKAALQMLASIMSPELTTIRQSVKSIGKKAAEILIFDREKENADNNYIFPVQLVVRETTKKNN